MYACMPYMQDASFTGCVLETIRIGAPTNQSYLGKVLVSFEETCWMHQVVKGFVAQSGDISFGNGSGGESIWVRCPCRLHAHKYTFNNTFMQLYICTYVCTHTQISACTKVHTHRRSAAKDRHKCVHETFHPLAHQMKYTSNIGHPEFKSSRGSFVYGTDLNVSFPLLQGKKFKDDRGGLKIKLDSRGQLVRPPALCPTQFYPPTTHILT